MAALPAEHSAQTMALLVDSSVKVVLAEGAVPVTVEHLMYSKSMLHVEGIDTAITLNW